MLSIEVKRAVQKLLVLPLPSKVKRLLAFEFCRRSFFPRVSDGKQALVGGNEVFFHSKDSFDFLFKEIFLKQDYNIKIPREAPHIVDCGSNIGIAVLFFKLMYPNSKIVAFEPQESAFKCLLKMVEVNHLKDVRCHNSAVAKNRGDLKFYIDDENPASLIASANSKRMEKKEVVVPAVQLSDYIEQDVDLLKLDIEGGELDVLSDLESSGKLARIHQMIIEYHHHIESGVDDMSVFLAKLEAAGFGYQLEGKVSRPYPKNKFQDIVVYAYNKRAHEQG